MIMAGPSVQIAGYNIYLTQMLGTGTFGTVYKGAKENGQPIAAKRIALTSHSAMDHAEVEKFCKQTLEHNNILTMLHIEQINQNLWIFMEYCTKGNLDGYFQNHHLLLAGAMPKLYLMKRIADGLDFLHGEGIVHRDIKPQNILVTGNQDPELAKVKIGDFGLSKCLDPNGDTSGMTTDAGTIMFKSPEFWQRDEVGRIRYHKYVDIFATGLTFLSMLQFVPGNPLRPQENTGDLDVAVESGKALGWIMYFREERKQPRYRPVADEPGDDQLTAGVKELIRRMLQYVPEHRHNAEELLKDINELLQQGLQAGEPSSVLNTV